MSDKLNEAIQEIVIKHGVVLSKDDPVLILQTMNNRLLEETRKAQQEMLVQFKEEMENISSQWKTDAKDKAEKVLNAALSSSKETMNTILRQATSESTHIMKKLISDSLTEARDLNKQTRKYNQLWMTGLVIVCSIFLVFLHK